MFERKVSHTARERMLSKPVSGDKRKGPTAGTYSHHKLLADPQCTSECCIFVSRVSWTRGLTTEAPFSFGAALVHTADLILFDG
jgi:hypothetical protein